MILVCTAIALTASIPQSTEIRVFYDVSYTNPSDEIRRLDVYTPPSAENLPVVVWCHGGGWTKGDKSGVHRKPAAFVRRGFIFVSINYRLAPSVTAAEQAGDMARAIRHVSDTCQKWGGDPNRIVIMGHSAGAHLAALVSTDGTYLKAQGLELSTLKACAAVDIAAYDMHSRFEKAGPGLKKTLSTIFGSTPEAWKRLSPITHVSKGRGIPPFLVVHINVNPQKEQSEAFVARLRAEAIPVRMHVAKGRSHKNLDEQLGHREDAPTKALFEFFDAVLK